MSDHKLAEAVPASGIVWAYRFTPDGTAAPVLPEQIDAALASHDGGWAWIHLALADARCRTWIAQHAPVSGIARETLAGPDQHLRLDVLGSEIVGVLPDLHQEFGEGHGDDIVRLRFVMTERLLITARQKPAHSVEINRRAIESGKLFPTALSFLDEMIDQFADAISRLAAQLGDELDIIEERVLSDEPDDERSRIGRIRMQTVRIHRQLKHLRAVFHRLESRLIAENAPIAHAIRSLAQKLDAIDHEVDSLHMRARLLLDEIADKMVATTNRRLLTLSVLTACLLPPTLVTGFFGMNTRDLPFQNTEAGTWFALLIALVVGVLIYYVLRRTRAL
ncbi:MAG: CorA family divalent cation transporter [Pseudolabrys sp.]